MTAYEFVSTPATLSVHSLDVHAGGSGAERLLCGKLDLDCTSGQRWAVLGPNGAGKSTLLSLLAGLLSSPRDSVTLDGYALHDIAVSALALRRAWCPQFWFDPFPVTALETVACAVTATRPGLAGNLVEALAAEWLAQFDAAPLREKDVRTLSGGERQRVAIATACAQGAPLLLLDEPTAHLDWPHQALFVARMKTRAQHGGLMLAAVHDLNLAWALASHVLLLDGRGGYMSGVREDVMQAATLAAAYGVEIAVSGRGDERSFRVRLDGASDVA